MSSIKSLVMERENRISFRVRLLSLFDRPGRSVSALAIQMTAVPSVSSNLHKHQEPKAHNRFHLKLYRHYCYTYLSSE